MKYNFLYFLLLNTFICYSQFGEQLIITEEAIRARSVFAADVDGDNDIDVLSASENDNKVIKLGNAIQEETEEESLDTPVDTGNSEKSENADINDQLPQKAKSTMGIITENETEISKIQEELSVQNNADSNPNPSFYNRSLVESLKDKLSDLPTLRHHASDQEPEQEQTEIEQIKVEIQDQEFQIFKDATMVENIPIESLTSSNINDISKTLHDKLNMSSESQFYIQSKLGSVLRFKEARKEAGKQLVDKKDSDYASEDNDSDDDNDLSMKMQRFKCLYKEQYLNEMDHWTMETIHQMDLRHESEINELRRMHTEQKQALLEEIKKRRDIASNLEKELERVNKMKHR